MRRGPQKGSDTMEILTCPVCHGRLERQPGGKNYRCAHGHSFDLSSSGYLHLLLSGQMRSKVPGDNKQMVAARRHFLEAGYYQPISDCLNQRILDFCAARKKAPLLLADAGCGEGYYTARLVRELLHSGVDCQAVGMDISKYAVDYAARTASRDAVLSQTNADGEPVLRYAVASLFDLPLKDHSCQVLINLFAPVCPGEFRRVLKRGGILVFAVASTKHLWELKQRIYDTPYENEKTDQKYEGFTLLDKCKVNRVISIDSQEQIDNLFTMTPYYYKSSVETADRVHSLGKLETQIDVDIITYQAK